MPNIFRDCIDCRNPFYITEKDQAWFATKIVPCSGCVESVDGVAQGTGFQINDAGERVACFVCEGKGTTPMEFPKRCYHCRKHRQNSAQDSTVWAGQPTPVPTRKPSRSPIRPEERANDKRRKVR